MRIGGYLALAVAVTALVWLVQLETPGVAVWPSVLATVGIWLLTGVAAVVARRR